MWSPVGLEELAWSPYRLEAIMTPARLFLAQREIRVRQMR